MSYIYSGQKIRDPKVNKNDDCSVAGCSYNYHDRKEYMPQATSKKSHNQTPQDQQKSNVEKRRGGPQRQTLTPKAAQRTCRKLPAIDCIFEQRTTEQQEACDEEMHDELQRQPESCQQCLNTPKHKTFNSKQK